MENLSNQIQSSTGETFQSQFIEELPVTGLIPAPISTENQVGLISGGATPHMQQQDLATIIGHNPFNQPLNENSPTLQGLGIANEYNTSSQALKQNITGNNTLNAINHQSSNHSSLIQIYPQVEERSRMDIGIPNGQIMTGERSTLSPLQNYHNVNSHNQWNSTWPQPNQLFAMDVNYQQHNSNYMQYTQIYNPQNNNYQSQVAVPNGNGEQVLGSVQLSRPEQSVGIQTHQVAPANANRVTTQFDQSTLILEPSFVRAPPSNSFLNISNQNATLMVPSAFPSNAIIPQQNQRQNLQIGGELENVAARSFRVNEGQQKQAWGNRPLEIGEGSSSKRQKINSPPRGIGGTGPASQQQSSNSGANAIGMQNQRNNGAYNNAAANVGMQNQGNNGAYNNATANVGMQNQGNNGAYNNATANVGMQNQGNNDADNPVEHARNSLYDPQFENLGLAIDPHLRIFLASKDAMENGYYLFS